VADHLFAISNWWASQLMLGGFLHPLQGYLRALRQVGPEFGSLSLVTPTAPGSVRVNVDDPEFLIRMQQFVADPKARYTATDPRGRPTMSSLSADGFSVTFLCGETGDERFSVRIIDGSESAKPVASATVKSIREGDWAAEPMIEDVLRASIAFWRPGTAWITTNSFKAAVRNDARDHLVVGWRTYLGRRSRTLPNLQLLTQSALPPGTQAKIVPPGGVLVGLQGACFEPSDPCQTDEAIAIREGLRPHGLLDLPKDTETLGRSELVKA
jgi:hypothetical protein